MDSFDAIIFDHNEVRVGILGKWLKHHEAFLGQIEDDSCFGDVAFIVCWMHRLKDEYSVGLFMLTAHHSFFGFVRDGARKVQY